MLLFLQSVSVISEMYLFFILTKHTVVYMYVSYLWNLKLYLFKRSLKLTFVIIHILCINYMHL